MGGWVPISIGCAITFGQMGANIVEDYFLGSWEGQEEKSLFRFFGTFICIFLLILFGNAARHWYFCSSAQKGYKKIRRAMLARLFKAPINLYYDVTPTGKILNRFGGDVHAIRHMTHMTGCFVDAGMRIVQCLFMALAIMPLVGFIIPLVFFLVYKVYSYFINASREVERLKSAAESPVISFLGESINGTSTIRAFAKETDFQQKNLDNMNKVLLSWQWLRGVNCWAYLHQMMCCMIIMVTSTVCCIHFKEGVDPVLVGLLLMTVNMLSDVVNWFFHICSSFERSMVSFDRCLKITEVAQEKEHRKDACPENWPLQGKIEFRDFSLRYRPDTDLVLKKLNFTIRPREKVGIVGRTGAGKSTICLSLCRLVEADAGEVRIDDQNIADLGLADLREKITIIQQDPVMFKGTLRYNLDPFGEIDEHEITSLLERAALGDLLKKSKKGLDLEIAEGGSNLSSGEKQLICICRAVLRKNRIVLMDEATANIDIATEQTIQRLIEEEFKHSTVLTVAHRINTIIKSDRVLVLDFGEKAEFDSPDNLLKNKKSLFYGLVKELEKKKKE